MPPSLISFIVQSATKERPLDVVLNCFRATASQRHCTMHQTLTTSIFLFLCATSSATPLVKRDGDYSKIRQQARYASNPRNGTAALLRTYAKYNWALPVSTNTYFNQDAASTPAEPTKEKVATASGSGSGSVVATPQDHNSEFLCPVTVGGQTLNLNVDTGSSDLYV